jgi:hypothetical protein
MHFLLDIMLTIWSRFLYVVKSGGYAYDRTMGTQQISLIESYLQKILYSNTLLPVRHYTTDFQRR